MYFLKKKIQNRPSCLQNCWFVHTASTSSNCREASDTSLLAYDTSELIMQDKKIPGKKKQEIWDALGGYAVKAEV